MRKTYLLTACMLLVASFASSSDDSNVVDDSQAAADRGNSGRVIEFGGEQRSPGGVVSAKVKQDPLANEGPSKAPPATGQGNNQGNSVKLITGGDPTDGNAKSGHLPILD